MLALLWGGPLSPSPAVAAFHVAEIHEVMVGVNGDPNAQYIEINERGVGQNLVNGSRLVAFGPTGTYLGVVKMMTNNVPNSGDGVRWLMGTTAFEIASGIQADFEFPAGIISPTGGMVCWGAFAGESNPNAHVDCAAYGSYSGALPPQPPPGNAPSVLAPGDCQQSFTRTTPSTFDASSPPTDTWADSYYNTAFSLAVPSPTNNLGLTGSFTFTDTDLDLLADCRDADDDGDGDTDVADNCPLVVNGAQDDADLDALGDACEAVPYGTNPADLDTDDDGCADGREVRTQTFTPSMGGDRDPVSPWDFYDVPVPALTVANTSGVRNKAVTLSDALAVVFYAGAFDNAGPNVNGVDYDTDLNSNGVEDGREYDRTPSSTPGKPWKSNGPNGAVQLADALVAVNQAGHSCTGLP
jgi:hypothetical protein